jgi:voltage-gated potassium channel
LLVPSSQSLLAVRILRLLRLFRILKLSQYVEEGGVGGVLTSALYRSRRKLFVFLCGMLTIVVIFGALYVIEGPQLGFTSIPTSI